MKLIINRLAKLTALAVLFIAGCKTKSVTEEKPPLIPVEEFFKNPEKFSWQISPDGEYIS